MVTTYMYFLNQLGVGAPAAATLVTERQLRAAQNAGLEQALEALTLASIIAAVL